MLSQSIVNSPIHMPLAAGTAKNASRALSAFELRVNMASKKTNYLFSNSQFDSL